MILNNVDNVLGLASRDPFDSKSVNLRGQYQNVDKWIKHENFSRNNSLKYNIALLYHSQPFWLFAYVNVMRLFAYSELGGCDVISLYETCTVVGFGCETEKLSIFSVSIAPVESCISQELDAPSNYTCVKHWRLMDNSNNTSNNLSCLGSLGSTLICNDKIMALMPPTSEESIQKALYLRVDAFQDWLMKFIPVGLWYDNSTKIKCKPEVIEVESAGATNVMVLYIRGLWCSFLYFFIYLIQ